MNDQVTNWKIHPQDKLTRTDNMEYENLKRKKIATMRPVSIDIILLK